MGLVSQKMMMVNMIVMVMRMVVGILMRRRVHNSRSTTNPHTDRPSRNPNPNPNASNTRSVEAQPELLHVATQLALGGREPREPVLDVGQPPRPQLAHGAV